MTLGINDLPEDTLVDIFLAIPAYRWGTRRDHSFPVEYLRYPIPVYLKRPPWVYAHVCRRWRQIVRSRPKLWANFPSIELSVPDSPSLELYLQFAQNAPLSLYFWTDIDAIHELVVKASSFSLLCDKVEQWEEVVFNLSYHTLPYLGRLAGSFLSLKVLYIINRSGGKYLWDLFADAPVLEELTFLVFDAQPKLPPSLRKYHGYWPGPVGAAKLLASAPQLVSCCFTSFQVDFGLVRLPEPLPTVFMPNLESLKLEDCWDDDDGRFMATLTLPNLRNLHLALTAAYMNFPLPDITQMLSRSNAPLRTLTLNQRYVEISEFGALFDVIPELEFYHWYDCHSGQDDNAILGMFDDPQVLPNLKTLIFESALYGRDTLRADVIADVLRARAVGGYRSAMTREGDTPGCLEYLGLSEYEVGEESVVALLEWSPHDDPHLERLERIKKEVEEIFQCPLHQREEAANSIIRDAFNYVIKWYKDFHIQAVLYSEIHLVLHELLLRGTSYPPGAKRAEIDWITQIEPIVKFWKVASRSYLTTSKWILPQKGNVYWVADKQMDVYDMIWGMRFPSYLYVTPGRRSMPMEFIHHELMDLYTWLPDWEHAEHPPRAYAPAPVIGLQLESEAAGKVPL